MTSPFPATTTETATPTSPSTARGGCLVRQGPVSVRAMGQPRGDIPVPGDYDGDGTPISPPTGPRKASGTSAAGRPSAGASRRTCRSSCPMRSACSAHESLAECSKRGAERSGRPVRPRSTRRIRQFRQPAEAPCRAGGCSHCSSRECSCSSSARTGPSRRSVRRQRDRVRELAAGQRRERVGHQRRGRSDDPGLRHRHQRRPGRRPCSSRSTPTRPTTASTSTGSATTAAIGARKVATVEPSATLPQTQPACLDRRARPAWSTAATGRSRRRGRCRRPRSPASTSRSSSATTTPAAPATSCSSCATTTAHSDLLFQTSDTTWQAYNHYGGNSLYVGAPAGRAYKVSYNRPFTTRGDRARGLALQRRVSDGPLARSQRLRRQLHDRRRHAIAAAPSCSSTRSFLSVGHDEYWSGAQRANVEAARDAGVNLAFFSGNEVFWKTRWENSIDGSATRLPHAGLATRRRTPTRRSIRSRRRGPAPGAIRGSARPPTAAGPRTR